MYSVVRRLLLDENTSTAHESVYLRGQFGTRSEEATWFLCGSWVSGSVNYMHSGVRPLVVTVK